MLPRLNRVSAERGKNHVHCISSVQLKLEGNSVYNATTHGIVSAKRDLAHIQISSKCNRNVTFALKLKNSEPYNSMTDTPILSE